MCYTPQRRLEASEVSSETHAGIVKYPLLLIMGSRNVMSSSTQNVHKQFFESMIADFRLIAELPTPTFSFGGNVGRTVTSLILSPDGDCTSGIVVRDYL